MTPDGTPIVGPTPVVDLLLATGHGTWLDHGRRHGRVIADLVSGRKPEIDIAGLTMATLAERARRPESAAMATKQRTYAEASIRVLKGLEPVKQRPGMPSRTDNPLHIVQEVIDNAADEAAGRFRPAHRRHAACRRLGQCRRRRPRHPLRPAPGRAGAGGRDRVHAAARRRQSSTKGSGGAYSFSGGLHGVGVSVTNALASACR